MAIEVFNRTEKKYMLNEAECNAIIKRISEYMEPDKHNKDGKIYTIANIYYDTDSDDIIATSIDKPVYKQKLRLRSYGVPELDDKVFLEIKKKYSGVVNKRRTKLKLREAYDLTENGIVPEEADYINKQVLEEIKYFLKIYDLKPKVYLAYDRKAFFDKLDSDFRVTFDTNIRTRREDVRLEAGSHGEKLLEDGVWLMEIKSSKTAPKWFVDMLSEMKIYPSSFSKYGTEYKKYMCNKYNQGDKKLCLNQYLTKQQRQQQYQPAMHSYV